MRLDKIKIDPEFAALIPEPTADELRLLEASIDHAGVRDPLVVWSHYHAGDRVVKHEHPILLDGHNRLKIVQEQIGSEEHVVDVPVSEIVLADRDAAFLWIEENQAGRRNLTDDQRAMIWASIMERRSKISRSEAAKARETEKHEPQEAKTTPRAPKERTREQVAKESNLSESKLRAAKELAKKDPEAAKQVRDGKKTLRAARKNLHPPKSVKVEEARIKKIVDGALKRIKPEDTFCVLQAMEQSFDVGNNILLGDALPAEKTPLKESRKLFEYLHAQLLQAVKGKKGK